MVLTSNSCPRCNGPLTQYMHEYPSCLMCGYENYFYRINAEKEWIQNAKRIAIPVRRGRPSNKKKKGRAITKTKKFMQPFPK